MHQRNNINLELTLQEANIIKKIIQTNTPSKDDELMIMALYFKLEKKISESHEQ